MKLSKKKKLKKIYDEIFSFKKSKLKKRIITFHQIQIQFKTKTNKNKMSYGQEIDSLITIVKTKIKEIDDDIIQMRKFIGDEHARRYRIAKEKLLETRNAKQQLDILLRRYKESNILELKSVCFISIFICLFELFLII